MQMLIAGMHRSGTSVVAGVMHMLGMYFGPEDASLKADAFNPTGYWERRDVCALNDALLAERGCTWSDVVGWDRVGGCVPEAERLAIRQLVSALDAHRPWMVKDPRLSLTIGAWAQGLSVPVSVIVSRNPIHVARSLWRRDRMPASYAMALWEYYAVSLLRAAPEPRLYVNYEFLINDPVGVVSALKIELERMGAVGLRVPSTAELLAFVQPCARRSDSTAVDGAQATILAALQGGQVEGRLSVSDAALAVLEARARYGPEAAFKDDRER